MRLTRAALPALALAACLALLAAPRAAAAYPQFQVTTGNTRCSLCHVAPAGGGLLNDYGRGESGDTISQFGGDGRFLYGAYEEPAWIKLGVDLRAMGLVRDYPGAAETTLAAFPMQGDTYVALSAADVTLYGAIGPRAQVREPESVADRFGAREYWLMWRPSTTGWYARVGRFLTPFGLRLADHTIYARRYLGLATWDEPYAVSAGKVEDAWEAHLTAFAPVPASLQGFGAGESGAAAIYERRIDEGERLIVGGQARAGFGDESDRYTVGGYGKYWLAGPRLLASAEFDLTLQDFAAAGSPSRAQLLAYLGATWFPHTGFMVTATYERYGADLAIAHAATDAYAAVLQYFPLAHIEILLEGKIEVPASWARSQRLAFLQLHYYL